jgi:hypothetical protein
MVSRARPAVAAAIVLPAAWILALPKNVGAAPAATEYEVKAAYLFNFVRFVTWPESAFASAEAPLTLCVLGSDPFGSVLDQTLANETVGGRPLAPRRIAASDDAGQCQLLFVSRAATDAQVAVLRALDGRPVLTVGDDEAFARAGGAVGFRLEAGTVRITVNQDALQRAGLTMSSQLLRIASLVSGAP